MSEPIVSFGDHDQRMQFAIDEARQSIAVFFDAFRKPQNNQTAFLLKVRFDVPEKVAHIWLADIDAFGVNFQGTVANEPNFPGLHFMQRVEFHLSQITDWMFIEDGYLVGGFTTQVIRAGMSPEEKALFDANVPYGFRD